MLSLKDGESHSQAQNVRWDENNSIYVQEHHVIGILQGK